MNKFLFRCHVLCLAGWMVSPVAEATKPLIPRHVQGCMIRGYFVPYADQRAMVVKPLAPWARKLAPKGIMGKEVILRWSGYGGDIEVPRFLVRSSGQMEVNGPCDQARLPDMSTLNLGSTAKTLHKEE